MRKRTPHHVIVSFTGQRLTHFGGVYLVQLFFKRLQLRKLLQRDVLFRQRNNRFNTAEEILALVYPIALSIGRIELTQLLKHNGVFHYLTGLASYPTPTTLRRFLLRMGSAALSRFRHLHDKLLAVMCVKPKPSSTMIFDLDSTVLVLCGKQEMAHVGYNLLKHGRPSDHPLLCFNALTKDFWHGELRAGDTHTAAGTLSSLEAVFAKVPSPVRRIIIRADKGFTITALSNISNRTRLSSPSSPS